MVSGVLRGRLKEEGREYQQKEDRFCCNLGIDSCKQGGGGGGGSKSIGYREYYRQWGRIQRGCGGGGGGK